MVTFFLLEVETSLITSLHVSLKLGIHSANYKFGGRKRKIIGVWTDSMHEKQCGLDVKIAGLQAQLCREL